MRRRTRALLGVLGWISLMVTAVSAAPRAPGAARSPVHADTSTAVWLPLVVQHAGAALPPPFDQVPPGDWLGYVNAYRAVAQLPPVSDEPAWHAGVLAHARYMVKNDEIGHREEPSNPWYTPEGAAAAASSNVLVSTGVATSDETAIDVWMQGPFHALGILDPRVHAVSFGSYREADGGFQMAAALDVLRGRAARPPDGAYPVMWPGDGARVPLATYPGAELPDPLSACPGYRAPTGLPIVLQLGDGSGVPAVTGHSFRSAAGSLAHCVYDEASYVNRDPVRQVLGRAILGSRDAIVLIPRRPLENGYTYRVSITVNGLNHTWSFTVVGAQVLVRPAAPWTTGSALDDSP